MAKKTKKVDNKKVAKLALSTQIQEALEAAGLKVSSGDDYAMTAGTLVVSTEKCDVQVKFITPKAGTDRYEVLVDEDEDAVEGDITMVAEDQA